MYTTTKIYFALYDKLSLILPKFSLRNKGNYYTSKSCTKIVRSYGKPGKVYIYRNNPGAISDYTRGTISLGEYISKYYLHSSNKAQIPKHLLDLSGYKICNNNIDIKQNKLNHELWQKVFSYAKDQLFSSDNEVLTLKFERYYWKNRPMLYTINTNANEPFSQVRLFSKY